MRVISDNDYLAIGQHIKEARLRKGWSQQELAEQSDLSVPYISLIECGRRHISLEALIQIASLLEISADFLLSEALPSAVRDLSPLGLLTNDCNTFEKQIIFDTALALKISLRQNQPKDSKQKNQW